MFLVVDCPLMMLRAVLWTLGNQVFVLERVRVVVLEEEDSPKSCPLQGKGREHKGIVE
jgi:hypothetical protein